MAKRKRSKKSKARKGSTNIGTPKRTKRKYTAKKKPRAKGRMTGGVPLAVLESRAAYMVDLVKRRGGTVRRAVKLTHRRPKAAAKLAAKTRKARSRRKK